MRKNDFNRVAWVYPILQQLFFGSRLERQSVLFFSSIKPSADVLILGGGTGNILKSLPKDQKVDFIDASGNMIKKARKYRTSQTEFINEDFVNLATTTKYDVVVCPFFLDCFEEALLRQIIDKIQALLKPAGKLLVADFEEPGTTYEKLLMKLMLFFFRVTTNLGTKKLEPIWTLLDQNGFQLRKDSREGFIRSSVLENH